MENFMEALSKSTMFAIAATSNSQMAINTEALHDIANQGDVTTTFQSLLSKDAKAVIAAATSQENYDKGLSGSKTSNGAHAAATNVANTQLVQDTTSATTAKTESGNPVTAANGALTYTQQNLSQKINGDSAIFQLYSSLVQSTSAPLQA